MKFRCATIACLCLLATAWGDTFIYSFSSSVEAIDDGAGIASSSNIRVGDSFAYTYQVAFSVPGEVHRYDGTTTFLPLVESPTFGYFHGQLSAGFLLPPKDGGRFHAPENESSTHYGYLFSPPSGTHTGGLVAGSSDSSIIIFKLGLLDAPVSQWQVGENLYGTLQAFDSGSGMTLVHLNVELTNITQVPEPGIALLVFLGAIVGLSKRRRTCGN
ncbi:MAG: PEP-CTERM sorting domain-containing protein [Limisphaerales bacterium]